MMDQNASKYGDWGRVYDTGRGQFGGVEQTVERKIKIVDGEF